MSRSEVIAFRRDHADRSEKENTGSSPTGHSLFDSMGFLLVRDAIPSHLIPDAPEEVQCGRLSNGVANNDGSENQVSGSLERYNTPGLLDTFLFVQNLVETTIGKPVYRTYYFDRFYHTGEVLDYHTDRPSCEISVSFHCGSNIPAPYCEWPFFIKSVEGSEHSIKLKKGDAVLYKGCERPHWRNPLTTPYQLDSVNGEQYYYHQMFMHFVLQQGIRSHHKNDR